jgi:hypothetical protein
MPDWAAFVDGKSRRFNPEATRNLPSQSQSALIAFSLSRIFLAAHECQYRLVEYPGSENLLL